TAGFPARALGAADRFTTLAAASPAAAMERCSTAVREHGAAAGILLPPEGSRSGARAVLRVPGVVRNRAWTVGVRRYRLHTARRRFHRRVSDRLSRDGAAARDDLVRSLEQRHRRRQSDRPRIVGAVDRRILGYRAWSRGAAGDPRRIHRLRAGGDR